MDGGELQDFVDREEIEDLLARLVLGIHARRWRRLAECFAADATANLHGLAAVGRDAIVDYYRSELRAVAPSERWNGEYSLDLDSARARTFTRVEVEHVAVADGRSVLLGHADRDLLLRTPQGWRVQRRTCVLRWTTLDGRLASATGLTRSPGRG